MLKYKSNYFVVNLYSFSTIFFFSYLFTTEITNKPIRKIIFASLFVWSVMMIKTALKMDYHCKLENQIYLSGLVLVLIQILAYFKEILDGQYGSILSNPKLILAFSILVFITCSFPLLAFLDYFLMNPTIGKAYTDILDIGNIFLSLGYLGAAICIRKTPPSTTSS